MRASLLAKPRDAKAHQQRGRLAAGAQRESTLTGIRQNFHESLADMPREVLAMGAHSAVRPMEGLTRSMVERVARCRDAPEQLERGIRMAIVTRNPGRVASRAIEIAEQTAFLLGGEFREFASDSWDPQGAPSQRPMREGR